MKTMTLKAKAWTGLLASLGVLGMAMAAAVVFAGAGVLRWLGLGVVLLAMVGGAGLLPILVGPKRGGDELQIKHRAQSCALRAIYVYLAVICVLILRDPNNLVPMRRLGVVILAVPLVQVLTQSAAILILKGRRR